ncbi:glycerophosphodiester phosphodiesterase family protein [Parasedimentitalea psychrophila]|uniref:Glycerophosphodiester phosphodiesterase family protein n=1 Tax=Parasedimentitalea psychrophila TaxID=2997337 RepID=A0A9Y2L2C4_9RHOB|nr:glycerophosphodiester phosphodiesterase family protein [Parasedimentitalea psychrophila]WIY26277.1 glycerophosphodiester phosphodiesterase family protein [Parasedimentitalea psychrophila]
MKFISDVLQAYGGARRRWRLFLAVHVSLRLLALALIAPLLGGMVNLAVSFSSQSALTDQDIALFVLSPIGFVLSLVVVSIVMVGEVTGFAVMAASLRYEQADRWQTARVALLSVVRKLYVLAVFIGLLLLRILLLAAPFAAVAGLVAWALLTEYDINYYLSYHPPAFKLAVALIGVIALALALVLLQRLSAWALALHLVLFEDQSPPSSFGISTQRMKGHHLKLQIELVVWVLLRTALVAVLAAVAGGIIAWMPVGEETDLIRVLLLSLVVLLFWVTGDAVLSAIALGALALILDRHFGGAHPPLPSYLRGQSRLRPGLLGFAGVAVVLAGMSLWLGQSLFDAVKATDEVEIIAHRGAAGSKPENTTAAIQEALQQGADWVEIDVQESADGHIVVMHDADLMKLARVNLQIHAAPLEQLQQVDIGSWYDPAYADQRIPLLSEVLLQVKGRAKLLIEFKHYGFDVDLEGRSVALVEAADMADQIAFMSLKYGSVQKAKSLRPDWRAGILAATKVGDLAGLDGDFVAVRAEIASPALIGAVQAAGKDIYVWTVNDPLQMSKMISMGVDGLITDEPALVHEVLRVRAQLNTPERMVLWLIEELGLDLNPREYRDVSP